MNQQTGRRHFRIEMGPAKDGGSWFSGSKRGSGGGEGGNRGATILAVLITAAVLALLIWYVVARISSGGNDTGEVLLVEAPKTPAKIEPEDRGGLQVPDQDKLVFDRVSGTERKIEERVSESAEAPVELPSALAEQPTTATAESAPAATQEPAPAVTAAKPPTLPPEQVAGAGFAVQLGAYGSRSGAESAWRAAVGRHSILSGMPHDLEPLSRSSGTLYRLRAGSFASRAEAESLCNRLKAAGQDCLVAER